MGKRAALKVQDKARRKAERTRKGPLQSQQVSGTVRRRYQVAAAAVLVFWQSLDVDPSLEELDDYAAQYIEHLYQEGDSYSMASDALAALQFYNHRAIGKLKYAWKLCGIWRRSEPPKRVLPFLPKMALALAGLAISLNRVDMAAMILIGFDAFLRTGEIFNLRKCHIRFDKGKVLISLEQSKTGKRHGHEESVIVESHTAMTVLQAALQGRKHGDYVRTTSPTECRQFFKQLLNFFHMNTDQYNWYSLRRGGATAFYTSSGGAMSKTLLRGRWESSTTARIYIQEATAQACEMDLTQQQLALLDSSIQSLQSFALRDAGGCTRKRRRG